MTREAPCIECGHLGADETFLCNLCKPFYADAPKPPVNDNSGPKWADEIQGDMS